MAADPRELLRIAERVADDEPVDWDAEATADPVTARGIQRLQQISAIGRVYRTPHEFPVEITVERAEAALASTAESWGELRIEEKLGEGSFGEVYRAYDSELCRHVALKLPREDQGPRHAGRQSRIEEARGLARVRHSNVLQVYGVAEHDGRVGIWTDLLEGQTLEEQLAAGGPLGAEEAAHIGRTMCAALAAVHEAGLVHRDVKTANIMRERGGRLVLMDFSCVAAVSEAREDRRVFGTPLFMAPELLRGEGVDERSDLYSLSVVLYRLVTGAYPVEAASIQEMIEASESPTRIPLRDRRPDLPDRFVDAVERGLESDPDARYRSAGEMEAALAHSVSPGRSRRWMIAAAALLLMALVTVVFAPSWFQPALRGNAVMLRAVDGDRIPLEPSSLLALGDQIKLEFRLTRPAYVYVLNRDQAGRSYVLFPLESARYANPLDSGVQYWLPDESTDWKVSSSGGQEEFMIIASKNRLLDLEQQLESIPRASETVAEMDLRGTGGLASSQPRDGQASLADLFASYSARARRDPDLWTWSQVFKTPEP